MLNTKFITYLLFVLFGVNFQILHAEEKNVQKTVETKQAQKVDAHFIDKPIQGKPLLVVVFHGLGRTSEKTQKWAQKKFAKKLSDGTEVKVKAINYEKVGLLPFQEKINGILSQINSSKQDAERAKIVQEEEAKLLPELRALVAQNIDKIIAEFDDIPLQNIVITGYSFGGLVSSVVVEVLGNSNKGQVQALLTSMAPPVGFINCAFGVADSTEEVSAKTIFPWIMHCEMGQNDPIFINGVLKMQHCFSVFDQLTEESKKHFTHDKHEGEHKTSRSFSKFIRKAIEIAHLRQQGKEAPVSIH
jgi:predicted esterase